MLGWGWVYSNVTVLNHMGISVDGVNEKFGACQSLDATIGARCSLRETINNIALAFSLKGFVPFF